MDTKRKDTLSGRASSNISETANIVETGRGSPGNFHNYMQKMEHVEVI